MPLAHATSCRTTYEVLFLSGSDVDVAIDIFPAQKGSLVYTTLISPTRPGGSGLRLHTPPARLACWASRVAQSGPGVVSPRRHPRQRTAPGYEVPPDRRGIDDEDRDAREAGEVRPGFPEGAVRIVEETNKPIAQVARDLGVNEGALGNWVNRAREAAEGTRGLSKDDVGELKRLRAEVAELRMERDVLIGHVERRARAGRSGRLVMS